MNRTLSYIDKFSLPYNQSLSLATPQEADLDDEQLRALLASPRYLLEREASAERSQMYHSEREGLMSSASQGLHFNGTWKLVAWLSHQKRLAHMWHLSWTPRHAAVKTRKYHKDVFGVTSHHTVASTASTVLATTNFWSTHHRFLQVGVQIFDLDGLIEIDEIKRPVKINSVGPGNVPHVGIPALIVILIPASLSSNTQSDARLLAICALGGT